MTTAFPSPGIIPAEIAGPEFWRPSTYRVRFEHEAHDLPTYAVICIARLGEDYGSKGDPVPTCDEHDAAALAIYDAVLPLYTTAVAVAATYPEMAVSRSSDGGWSFHVGAPAIPGGGGGGGFAEVPGIPGRELPETPSPIPVPAALPLLVAAMFLLWRMTR